MKKSILAILLLAGACRPKENVDEPQICTPGFKPTAFSLTLPATGGPTVPADPRTVTLSLGTYISDSYPGDSSVADSALYIASVLLSSNDFKSVINGMTFTCANYGRNCGKFCQNCNDRIPGSVVLDSVFREKNVKLDLFLRDCTNEFGHSTKNIKEVYSCKPVVFRDERQLSPAYCYAYHLAHEYMHIVGYFHTDHKDDVAERTGWIGWEILLRWHQAGVNVMALHPGEH